MGTEPEAGAPPEMHRRPLRTDDLFELRYLAEVVVAPDGRRIACVERRVDRALDRVRSRVLIVEVADGSVRSPSPDDAADSSPRWLPDGSGLVFQAERGAAGIGPWRCDPDAGSVEPWPGVPQGGGAFAVAPDGRSLVVVVARDDAPAPDAPLWEVTGPGWHQDAAPTMERRTGSLLWIVAADGTARALTEASPGGPGAAPGIHDRAPAWSPDGRTVAFLSDRVQVDGSGADVAQATTLSLATSPGSGAPAGQAAHPLTRPGRLWLVPADGSATPAPLLGPAAMTAWTWSPDAREIAWLGNPEPVAPGVAARLWLTSVAGGGTRCVALPGAPAPGSAVRSDDPRGMGDATIAWTVPDRLWLRWADHGASRLGWIDSSCDMGPLTTLVDGDRAVLSFGVQPGGNLVAHVTATVDHPGELAVCDADGSGERILTDRNAFLRTIELGRTRNMVVTGPGDLPVEGWVTEPPPSQPRPPAGLPLVVSVHGGPHYPIGWRFSFETQRLAARGYAVLAGNGRGSVGYGDAFATAIHGDWGGADLGDTHALLDAALDGSTDPLDPERVAITGVSYGGYHTLRAICLGTRFRAAIAENPISDLISTFGSAEDDGSFWVAEMGGAPWDRPREYADRSPLLLAERIQTPLLLIHAEEDHNCPIAQSEEIFSALTRLGRPVRFLRARGLGHLMNFTGSGRFRLARAAAIDDWLDRWLDGGDR